MSNTGKIILKGLGIVAVIAVLLVAGFFAAKYWFIKPKIDEKINTAIKGSLGEEYLFRYSNFDLSLFGGDIRFDSVYITKSTISKEAIAKGATDIPHLSMFATSISAGGIKFHKVLLDKEIRLNTLNFQQPVILHVSGEDFAGKGVDGNTELIQVNRINIENGQYKRFNRINGQNIQQVIIPEFDFTIDTIIADLADTTKQQPFKVHNYYYTVKNPEVKSPNTIFKITAAEISGDKLKSSVTINDFKLEPQVGKNEISEIKGRETTWIRLQNDQITISGLQYDELVFNQVLYASLIDINGFDLDAYQNKNYPDPEQKKEMPQGIIKNIGFDIDVQKVNIENGGAIYTEMPDKGNETGFITFRNFKGTISNVTNLPSSIEKDPKMTASASGEIMGACALDVSFEFDMSGNDNAFSSKGTVGSFSMPKFNQIAVPVGYIRIEEGQLNSASFNMQGNDNSATGELKFLYENLELQLLNEKTLEAGFLKELTSFVGDIFVVKDANPMDGETRIAEMQNDRLKTRSFFTFWWKTILTGIREAIGAGFKNKEETSTKEKEVTEEEEESKEGKTAEEDGSALGEDADDSSTDAEGDKAADTEDSADESEGQEEEKGFFSKIFNWMKDLIKKIIKKVF